MAIFQVSTQDRLCMKEITAKVQECVDQTGIRNGLCNVYLPHTTAGVTINENADPDVVRDMARAWDEMIPHLDYRHAEGNSRAHVLSSMMGCSLSVPVENGRLCLGVWQGIYFCEFDGPRTRRCRVTVLGE